jgi:predicted extracellular nuclease
VSRRTALRGALGALVLLACGTAPAAAAPSPHIVISQLYGGGGNLGATHQNDYVELFNRGTTSVSLDGWSVQYASATGTGNFASNSPVALSGTVPPGRYYLVRLAGGVTGAPLPTPDATATAPNMSGTAGKVIVANTTTGLACNGGSTPCSDGQLAQIVDLVGYGGANFFEGAAAAPTLSTTTAGFRGSGGCVDTDSNSADFAAATPAPRNSASPAILCAVGSAAPSSVSPGDTTLLSVTVTPGSSPPSTGLTVTADLTSIGGSATQQLADAGNNTFTYQATVAAATPPGATTLPVTIADAEGRTGSAAIALTVSESCGDPKTPIHEVQGDDGTSPLAGQVLAIEGVVVGSFQAAGEFGGFYVQEPNPDDDPATSEGIFVFSSLLQVSPGDVLRVRGRVTELGSGSASLTELAGVSTILDCGDNASVPASDITLPVASMTEFERYEGMLVHFTQALTASDTFTLGRFGEVRLAAGGRLYNPTAVTTPGPAALALQDLNNRRSFLLDDGNNQQNIDPTRLPIGGLTATNTLRSGYTVENLTGVFDERFSRYRVQPVAAVPFVASNPRTEAPDDVGGNLKVASFNVLNFFNGNGTHQEGEAGGFPTERGASSLFEFDRQLAKEVSALTAIDADIVGLMELENDAPPNSAVEDLVDALNDAAGAGTYAFVDTGVVGTDQIRVALVYRPARVTPVGPHKLLTSEVDPRFDDTRNRPALAQTFVLNQNPVPFTVVVNHLKSKGSGCDDAGDPDTGDGQGPCNLTRTRAAEALLDWLAGDPTASGTSHTLLMGDLNSYTFEDPITALTDGGYRNLVREHGGLGAYSFVFDGQSGYLDHALASPSLAERVTGATDWHINADEPIVLDYNVEFKTAAQEGYLYDPGPYRSSDHDPLVVGLDMGVTFDELCSLTRAWVTSEITADGLCDKLDAAERAAAKGNTRAMEKALAAYVKQLRGQIGKTVTAERAEYLIGLAETL